MTKKKILVVIGATAIIVMAAVNVNLALVSGKSFANLTLANIVSLAKGESDICESCGKSYDQCKCECSVCGQPVDWCICTGGGASCDSGSCWGKYCHEENYNIFCPCYFTGVSWALCM